MTAALYVALYGLFFISLSYNVIQGRRLHRVVIGDGANTDMLRRMRSQANFAEYTPIFLILLLVSEQVGLGAYYVHFFGILFLLGRCLHAYGILKAEKIVEGRIHGLRYRLRAIYITYGCILALSLYLLGNYIFQYLPLK